jgi:hypothetical protein
MATWDNVQLIAKELPGVREAESYGNRAWRVGNKNFAWERPLRRSDFEALGIEPPDEPILAVRTPSVAEKEMLVEAEPEVCFTTPHFNGFPAVLVWLNRIPEDALRELLVEARLSQAPTRMGREYLGIVDEAGSDG